MADWNRQSKPDSWRSAVNRFCKYCKCWVADNAVSWAGHEQGARHKKAVEDKLMEMKRQAVMTQKSNQDEKYFLQRMEESALRDYKNKDIKNSRDFTAKLYNNEDLPDVAEKYETIRAGYGRPMGEESNSSGKPPDIGKRMYEKMAAKSSDPMLAPTGDEPDKWDKDYQQKKDLFTPVSASAYGTKYHKESKTAKFWYEAKDDSGASYYYNITSGKSRWDPPPNGFVSISEQQELEDKKVEKAAKKAKVVEENKYFHGEHKRQEERLREMPDMSKNDPYGGGGWTKVESSYSAEPEMNLGLPEKRPKQEPVIDKTEEQRLTFHEKTVASMSDKYGVGGSSISRANLTTCEEEGLEVAKPKISFRKRKNISVRERTDDD